MSARLPFNTCSSSIITPRENKTAAYLLIQLHTRITCTEEPDAEGAIKSDVSLVTMVTDGNLDLFSWLNPGHCSQCYMFFPVTTTDFVTCSNG